MSTWFCNPDQRGMLVFIKQYLSQADTESKWTSGCGQVNWKIDTAQNGSIVI